MFARRCCGSAEHKSRGDAARVSNATCGHPRQRANCIHDRRHQRQGAAFTSVPASITALGYEYVSTGSGGSIGLAHALHLRDHDRASRVNSRNVGRDIAK